MTTLPVCCPQCNRITAWSPLRVWCMNCGFTMTARRGERQDALIARWNAAIEDGEGYAELVRVNNARAFAKQLQGSDFGLRNTELTID